MMEGALFKKRQGLADLNHCRDQVALARFVCRVQVGMCRKDWSYPELL